MLTISLDLTGIIKNCSRKIVQTSNTNKKFSSKGNFNKHKTAHEKSEALKCDICLKVFHNKSNLTKHYRIHTGEKPFACQVCERKFAQKSILVRHQATHSDVRSFKCTICPEGRYFKTKHQLTNHMVYHYEPKFACSHCDYKAHTSSNLKKHEKNH